ncbi:MAG TPA: NADP-dependent isocitrate dehydrogenase, partial [Clostridia bacterium]
ALHRRGALDNNKELVDLAKRLEKATLATIEQGVMTGDLIGLFKKDGVEPKKVNSKQFLQEIKLRLENL